MKRNFFLLSCLANRSLSGQHPVKLQYSRDNGSHTTEYNTVKEARTRYLALARCRWHILHQSSKCIIDACIYCWILKRSHIHFVVH